MPSDPDETDTPQHPFRARSDDRLICMQCGEAKNWHAKPKTDLEALLEAASHNERKALARDMARAGQTMAEAPQTVLDEYADNLLTDRHGTPGTDQLIRALARWAALGETEERNG